jgi:hypothetical protein
MNTFITKIAGMGLLLLPGISAQAQYAVTSNQTAQDILDYLTGLNVTTTNAVLTCDTGSNGIFTYGGTVLPMGDGVVLGTSNVNEYGQPGWGSLSFGPSTPGDPTLSNTIGTTTNDACVLECDVVADYDTLYLNYSFASEEYPEWNCSVFNDGFGFYITGPGFPTPTNFAIVPNTNIITAINSVNDATNPGPYCTNMGPGSPFSQYYIDNATGTDLAFDGMTSLIEAFIVVNTGTSYHLKFVVANATDHIFQSGVFMQGGSLSSKDASVTKVNQVTKTGKTIIYPNPVKDHITVKLPIELDNETITATVTNVMGQNVFTYSGKGSGLNNYLKIKQLSAGSYIMYMKADGYHQVLRFQKQD